ncbi:hypothetical protein F0L74_01695 [Chitinophaga agrisoli]|uniref:Uncharacterized protein n=1 Tax=Chitinophaga agrisoli TaxID=2607653 RepID=A0A5B2VXX9_9BACT|nr:hypothetical protein [Chitinophaga agrisoli]KAA2244713.1 hypothetical protein F0L74_01695 [Chitinophaga agrisoli]
MIQAKASNAVLDTGHLLLKIDTLLRQPVSSPTWDEVLTYFIHNGLPARAAACFFDHYETKGWKTATIPPVINWQTAAKNWVINATEARAHARMSAPVSY